MNEEIPDWSALDRALAEHPSSDENEARDVARIREFLLEHPRDAHRRSQRSGHLTGSAFVLDAKHERVLLLHHGKLKRWLQPGGHGEGETDPRAIALREVEEETGLAKSDLTALRPLGAPADQVAIFDVDIHRIPGRPNEPEHAHLDLRFAWVANENATPRISEESRAMDWFPLEKPPEGADDALLRAFQKLRSLA
jgi:8-oxo-dGTP pyrophosphatase MutT (NUDIX family)